MRYRFSDVVVSVSLLLIGFVSTASAQEHWGGFSAGDCTGNGLRQFSAILWDIPWGQSWEQACAQMPADINGHHFDAPARCVTTTNEWGQFDVPDPSCASFNGCVGQVGAYDICGDESNPQQKCCPPGYSCQAVGPYTGPSGGLTTTDHYCTQGQITCKEDKGRCTSNWFSNTGTQCATPTVTNGSPCCTSTPHRYPILDECGDASRHPIWPSGCSTKYCIY